MNESNHSYYHHQEESAETVDKTVRAEMEVSDLYNRGLINLNSAKLLYSKVNQGD